jgi:hypothetical protein
MSTKQLDILSGPPHVGDVITSGKAGQLFKYSPDGRCCATSDTSRIEVVNADDNELLSSFKTESPVNYMCFSPSGELRLAPQPLELELYWLAGQW